MKKYLFSLSVLVAAAALFVGVQSYRTNAAEKLLVQNVEALSQDEGDDFCQVTCSGRFCCYLTFSSGTVPAYYCN